MKLFKDLLADFETFLRYALYILTMGYLILYAIKTNSAETAILVAGIILFQLSSWESSSVRRELDSLQHYRTRETIRLERQLDAAIQEHLFRFERRMAQAYGLTRKED